MPQTTGFTVWLTGMNGAGKTTLANYLGQRLRAAGRKVEVLDWDVLREPLAKGLGPTEEEREEGTLRLGLVARLLTRNDCVAVVADVSPLRETRDQIRKDIGRFVEVFVDCPTEVLIQRDTTGLYKKALAGERKLTGVTDPYETPQHAEITVFSDRDPVEESAAQIIQGLTKYGYLTSEEGRLLLAGRKLRPAPAKAATPPKGAKPATAPQAAKPAKGSKPAKPEKQPKAKQAKASAKPKAKAAPAKAKAAKAKRKAS